MRCKPIYSGTKKIIKLRYLKNRDEVNKPKTQPI